jgi:hypothetical protein
MGTSVLEESAETILPWLLRQKVPPECCYLSTKVCSVASQKAAILIVPTMRTGSLVLKHILGRYAVTMLLDQTGPPLCRMVAFNIVIVELSTSSGFVWGCAVMSQLLLPSGLAIQEFPLPWITYCITEKLLTYGVEPFLRSHHLRGYSRTSQHFMQPVHSLLCPQEPSTGPYPEPDRSSPYHPVLFKIYFNNVHPSMSWSS